jgi:tyrosinase
MKFSSLFFGLVLANSAAAQATACSAIAIRKEWRELKTTEQQAYLNAVKCLRTKPSLLNPKKKPLMGGTNAPKTRWEDFSWYGRQVTYSRVHQQEFANIHNTPMFLPWHRLMLTLHGKALKTECRYTGPLPYWDWSVDASNVTRSSIWSSTLGFGGNKCFSSKTFIITLSS